ncbi:hypothetical protein ASZ90_009404 [hydrocarbon metagenome]|uniref:Uncharacterized protein n=1 Tax=hydrocarbon metagenome TaxID=938273 RepID=A0A0W8FIV8_9ZZZZ
MSGAAGLKIKEAVGGWLSAEAVVAVLLAHVGLTLSLASTVLVPIS